MVGYLQALLAEWLPELQSDGGAYFFLKKLWVPDFFFLPFLRGGCEKKEVLIRHGIKLLVTQLSKCSMDGKDPQGAGCSSWEH